MISLGWPGHGSGLAAVRARAPGQLDQDLASEAETGRVLETTANQLWRTAGSLSLLQVVTHPEVV